MAEFNGKASRQSEVGTLARVVLKHPRDAFLSRAKIAAEWRRLDYLHEPDLQNAAAEFDKFTSILGQLGAELLFLPANPDLTLDSIYVHDASLVCSQGIILGNMGKRDREGEPEAQAACFEEWGVPILGRISPPGLLEGGDAVWLGERTLAVGHGYRTNLSGIGQLRALLTGSVDTLIEVPLPHWRGPRDVFHLMSILSPLDRDLLLVYSPLMPVFFRDYLLERGFQLVEVPDEEFDSMGANALALAPRHCLLLEGNPVTRRRLEEAGVEVTTYQGREISQAGCGGPTCLTRPLERW